MADETYILPKLPVKQGLANPPVAIQMAIAEIIEESDIILKEKVEENSQSTLAAEPEEDSFGKDSILPGITFDQKNIKEAFVAFSQKKPPSTAALIKMFEPQSEGNEVKVFMHKANLSLTDPIKIEWQNFLRQYFNKDNLTLALIVDDSVIQQTKAFTPREQLEELTRENPLVRELIKKLNLKLK